MAIRIVVDSASDVTPKEAESNGWYYMPMTVTFGDTEYLDRVSIDPNRFYELLIESDELPHTSQLTPSDFEKVFREIIEEGDTPLAITISSKLSGTYQSACVAAEEFDGKAIVVDSLSAALGEAIFVRYADRLVKDGLEAEEIARILRENAPKVTILALLDTLEYLKKGGRISAAVELAGSLLKIKPVVSVPNGEVAMVGKARGSKNGNNLLNELVNKVGVDFSKPYTLAYSGTDTSMLDKYVEDMGDLWKHETDSLPVIQIGATIGTHAGPGAIAVAFFAKN